ncbi:MAG TPA: rhodanese-like domain-containing protein [Candidatus Margulisiibacteriota bacterium]|nr:rhodanese-like domain-containing protein [Candidatus Margulisiibacteriota bacterium]
MAIRQVTPDEAQKLLLDEGYRYLDVRTEGEFAAGHPATAVNIPVASPNRVTGQMAMNSDFLAVVEAHLPKHTKIVVGCQSGGRSQRAAELLTQAGYSQVVNMEGGFGGVRDQTGRTVVAGWAERGLPICTECGAENSYAGLREKLQ